MYFFCIYIDKKNTNLQADSKISINISPYVTKMGDILKYNSNKYENLIYIPQDNNSLNMLLWGYSNNDKMNEHFVPIYPSHPIFINNKVRFFVDPITWINYLSKFDFSFGTRIHGNITSLLAGTPAVVLAHDSRTKELAEYFEIPYKSIDLVNENFDANSLYQDADYTKMNSGHKDRFNHFINFCNKNSLNTIFDSKEEYEKNNFENDLLNIQFPAPIQSFGNNNEINLLPHIRKKLIKNELQIKKALALNKTLKKKIKFISKKNSFLKRIKKLF